MKKRQRKKIYGLRKVSKKEMYDSFSIFGGFWSEFEKKKPFVKNSLTIEKMKEIFKRIKETK